VIGAPGLAVAGDAPAVRLGWFPSFRAMLAWELADLRLQLPVLVAIQLLAGVGTELGFGLFFHPIPERVALFVTTGIPVINLIIVGTVVLPQNIASQKLAQTYDFLASLPVRRLVNVAATYVVMLVIGLPAVVVTIALGVARYHLHLTLSGEIVPALFFVTLAGTMLGLALGHGLNRPNLTQSTTQLLVFAIFGFCPIVFPSAHLPRWLADLNTVLPFESMATLTRAGLTSGLVSDVARALLVVALWLFASLGVVTWTMGRRR
jgi:ABC-2 type transport system permease protein